MSLQPVNFCSLCLKNVFFYPTNSWKPADIHCGGQKTEKQHSLTSEELQPEERLTFLLDKREKLIFKPTHDPTAQIHQTLLIQARGLNASAGWWLTTFHKLRINSSWRFRSHCKSVSEHIDWMSEHLLVTRSEENNDDMNPEQGRLFWSVCFEN